MSTNGNGPEAGSSCDDLLIGALATGASYGDAAEYAGISKSTVARRMSEPYFRRRVWAERSARVDELLGRLATASPSALDTVIDLAANATSETVRLNAARLLLDMAVRSLDRDEFGLIRPEEVQRMARDMAMLAINRLPDEEVDQFMADAETYFRTGRASPPSREPPSA